MKQVTLTGGEAAYLAFKIKQFHAKKLHDLSNLLTWAEELSKTRIIADSQTLAISDGTRKFLRSRLRSNLQRMQDRVLPTYKKRYPDTKYVTETREFIETIKILLEKLK